MDFHAKLKTMLLHVGQEYEARVGERAAVKALSRPPKYSDLDLDVQILSLFKTMERLTELKNLYDDNRLNPGRPI